MKPPVHSKYAQKYLPAPDIKEYARRFVEFHRPYAIACLATFEARSAFDLKYSRDFFHLSDSSNSH